MADEQGGPWLSVLMPLHDGAAWVDQAITSVVEEVGPAGGVELLVVDDASSDDGPAKVAQHVSRHPWIRLLGPVARGSWTATTNVALAEASGRWVCVLHQDDVWLPGRLDALRRHVADDLDVVFSGAVFLDAEGKVRGRWTPPTNDGCRDAAALARALYIQNWACVPSVSFDAVAARELGGFDEDLWYTPDWDLWLRLVQRGRALAVREASVGFRLHGGSQTMTGSRDAEDFRQQHDIVQTRHRWAAGGRGGTLRGGALATEVNVTLAAALETGVLSSLPHLLAALLRARPGGVWAFLRWSRIGQRTLGRLRSGLTT